MEATKRILQGIPRRLQNTHTHFGKTEQTSEPDMSEMLELSDQKFKMTVVNILTALTE